MEKYYKKLMNNKRTLVARFADSLFILLLVTVITFGFTVLRLGNFLHSLIITVNVDIIVILLMSKMQGIQIKRFKKSLDARIRDKLILERIVFSKGRDIAIKNYKRIGQGEYINAEGQRAMLLTMYPESVLSPKELLEHITGEHEEIIASCTFDDDCYLLCKRMGIELRDKKFLLQNADMDIDNELINKEIETEVKEISEIRNKRKRTSFAKERWSKYLLTSLLLLATSSFMGKFKIIYIAFAGMCMSFCFMSLFVSKSQ